jgi:predicted acetyltransferase
MAIPLLQDLGLRTLVITTDDDNLPSIRTCEKLGCELECTVNVPRDLQLEYELSARKRRYIWTIPQP